MKNPKKCYIAFLTLIRCHHVVVEDHQVLTRYSQNHDIGLEQHIFRIEYTITINYPNISESGIFSGSLIQFKEKTQKSNFLITCAHAFDSLQQFKAKKQNPSFQLKISFGATQCLIPENHIFIHPEHNSFDQNHIQHDVALIQIPHDCQTPSWVKPIPIGHFEPIERDFVFIQSGYGNQNKSKELSWFENKSDNSLKIDDNIIITQSLHNSVWPGDSGSPLILKTQENHFFNLGILSIGEQSRFSLLYKTNIHFNSAYFATAYYIPWIESITKQKVHVFYIRPFEVYRLKRSLNKNLHPFLNSSHVEETELKKSWLFGFYYRDIANSRIMSIIKKHKTLLKIMRALQFSISEELSPKSVKIQYYMNPNNSKMRILDTPLEFSIDEVSSVYKHYVISEN